MDAPNSTPIDASSGSVATCQCRECLRARNDGTQVGDFFMPTEMTRMVLCATCGGKHCPHATNHAFACTNSNEPGQPGSAYE